MTMERLLLMPDSTANVSEVATITAATPPKEHAKTWGSKEISLSAVSSVIPNGSSVYIGSCGSSPETILNAMVEDFALADIQIVQGLPGGKLPHLNENVDRFRTSSFFCFTRTAVYKPEFTTSTTKEGLADYTPISFSSIPRLMEESKLKVDIAIIKVTPPHKGFVSLGMGVECTRDAIRHASVVIAEVNDYMPWTEGPSKISIDHIDYWVRNDMPLLTSTQLWPEYFRSKGYEQSVLDAMGRNIVREIPDGATLKFGWSPKVFCVFPFLRQRKNLGLHTDVYTEALFRLQEEGVINNSMKTIDKGRTIAAQAHGSTELYEFIDRNPAVEFHPASYVDDPQVMARIDNLVAVVGALKVDLTGQVATESIAHKFYGGVWSDDDSIRGSRLSKNGKAIVVLPSVSLHGRSNIVFSLPPGTGVAITRSDAEYVVTEHGIAYIYGKSIRERCLELINIAHPMFRQELLEDAKKYLYVSRTQPGNYLLTKYPEDCEELHRTVKGRDVFTRPIKPSDEDMLRHFFHRLSDHSVYLRYFRRMKSMPQRILQKTTDLDYSRDMSLIVLYPAHGPRQEMVAIGQWVNDAKDNTPEAAFQVRDDWQGEGLGTFLFRRLVEIARRYGISTFKADVLDGNKAMKRVFEKSGLSYSKTADFGVVTYTLKLQSTDGGDGVLPAITTKDTAGEDTQEHEEEEK